MPCRPGTIRQRPCLRGILLVVGEPSSLGDARCHCRRDASTRSAARCETVSFLAVSPAFDRSLARPEYHSRLSCARLVRGLSPGEHNFDPLGGDTHCWTTWNPPKYATQRARPFACHYHTHATTDTRSLRGSYRGGGGGGGGVGRTGRGREGRTCI